MGTTTSVNEIDSCGARPALRRALTVLEILVVYSGILLQIWRWQFAHPRAWMLLWVAVLASHFAHGDSLRELGLAAAGLGASARTVLPLSFAVFLPLLVYGLTRHALVLIAPGKQTLVSFFAYAGWCAFQQYLAQSYFHRRLMRVIQNPHLSSLVVALMIGAAHIPNPVLMVVTTLGGFFFSEIFVRRRNIWPLALAQAAGGLLIAAVLPASLIHNMRVGPGYFFYGIR